MPARRLGYLAGGLGFALVAAATAVAIWRTEGSRRLPGGEVLILRREPARVMGTSCLLLACPGAGGEEAATAGLEVAEEALRRVEALMSRHLEASEVSRLNRAGAGEEVPLSPPTLAVLQASRALHGATAGAFDATCLPLLELWREAGRAGVPPAAADLARAREESCWEGLVLEQGRARKTRGTVRVDLGGIAKGHGIDEAAAALAAACPAGLVDVGGDLRCFGPGPEGGLWRVAIRDPFGPGRLGALLLRDRAVCTSGDYFRFVEIEGRRLSHIVDPRTGRPANASPSVTVVGRTARTADGWATALSVLGPEGLALLPRDAEELEALVIAGEPGAWRAHATPGFGPLLAAPLPEPGRSGYGLHNADNSPGPGEVVKSKK